MAETSKIEWTDATVNFWWGCTKVGPGCDHCYAETWDKRTGGAHWGTGAPRRWIKSAAATLDRLNRKGGKRVFIQSMSDLFDNEVPPNWLALAWHAILAAPDCRIQIVTKRISAVEKRLASIGITSWPAHAGLMITVVNQAEANRDIPRLLALKEKLGIPWVGLSCEPLLGPIDLGRWHGVHHHPANRTDDQETLAAINIVIAAARTKHRSENGNTGLDWVICGGESGPVARPMHPDWARFLRDQCQAAGVAFHFKQWGEWGSASPKPSGTPGKYGLAGAHTDSDFWPQTVTQIDSYPRQINLFGGATVREKVGKKASGRLLDGREWNEVPA